MDNKSNYVPDEMYETRVYPTRNAQSFMQFAHIREVFTQFNLLRLKGRFWKTSGKLRSHRCFPEVVQNCVWTE